MQKAEKRLQAILQKYNTNFVAKDYSKLDVNKKIFFNFRFMCLNKTTIAFMGIIFMLVAAGHTTNLFNNSTCMIDMPSDASKWFREPEICDICEGVTEVVKVKNVSASAFYSNFVGPAKPVVVTDGAKYWPASKIFTFKFFQKLYKSSNHESESSSCQFFPYKTEFTSLHEALNMDVKRAELENGEPWYIGWSNCNDYAGRILRKHYEVPYFLPNTSENIALNWIFMGGPGQGAHMHVSQEQWNKVMRKKYFISFRLTMYSFLHGKRN
jgi:hypothetical protein